MNLSAQNQLSQWRFFLFTAAGQLHSPNPTMLRLVARYAREAADDMEAKDRGALYQLAQECENGQGQTLRAWDSLSHIADYCSGQAIEGRRDAPDHIVSMGKWWEQLSSETVENF